MKLRMVEGLPFVDIKLIHDRKQVILSDILIDTGSESSLISVDIAIELGLDPGLEDKIYTIRGVGGVEYVYEKCIDCVEVGEISASNLNIQIGAMDYGFAINGILGMDFLLQNKVIIDLNKLELHKN